MIAAIALLGLTTASAQDTQPTGWSTHGELREILSKGTDFAVDDHGTTVGQGLHLDQRIRAGLSWSSVLLRVETEWDLMSGQLVGDTWNIARSADERRRDIHGALTLGGFQPRKLFLGTYLGNARVEVGLMTSHWGLGLLANDGDHEPLFGREDFGDRVIRAKATLFPFQERNGTTASTFLIFALDTVLADDLAVLTDGQLANQVIAAILHDDGPGTAKFGAYGVFRNQMEKRWERSTQAGVLDLYGSLPVALSDDTRLWFEGEAIGILGWTSRAQSYGSPQGLHVRNGAIALKTRFESPIFDAHLNLGAASADGNPDDSRSVDFMADRDFDVGMVLFDEVMGAIEAGTHGLASDPRWSGRAPDGAELIATEGAWRRSAYVQPAVVLRPIGQLELKVGGLVAQSLGPVSQAFYTVWNGGSPTNHLNQDTTGLRHLGAELDWGVRVSPVSLEDMESWVVRPRLEVQGGHAFLGAALGGGTVHLVQGALRLEW